MTEDRRECREEEMLRAREKEAGPECEECRALLCVCVIGGEPAQSDSYGKYAMTTLETKQHQLKFWWGL